MDWKSVIQMFILNAPFIGIMFFLAWRFKNKARIYDSYSYTPDLVVTIGMIGTFFGIVVGLWNFDSVNIEASIPNLLNGLKTAFLTSLCGLVISAYLKKEQSKVLNKNKKKDVEDLLEELIDTIKRSDSSTIKDAMVELKNTTKESNKVMIHTIASFNENIGKIFSKGQGSLTEQMKLLREGMLKAQEASQDRLDMGLNRMTSQMGELVKENKAISSEIERGNNELIKNFIDFREDMAKAFTEEFTEALTKSIQDLNNQLQEQLGENFKNAVNKLVDWQEHYIETIKNTTNLLETTTHSIKNIEGSFVNITDKAEILLKVSEELQPTIEGLNKQQENLGYGLSSFSKVSDEFKNKVDLIAENTERLENTIENNSNKMLNNLNSAIFEFTKLSEAFDKYSIEIARNFEERIINFDDEIERILKDSIEKMKTQSDLVSNVAHAQVSNMENVTENIANQYSESIDMIAKHLKETFENADKAMIDSVSKIETTMENTLENFAGMLEKVSEKFVDDYTPLTNRLKEIVHISSKFKEN